MEIKMARFYLLLFLCITWMFHSFAAYELAIVTMFRNEAPYLKEWIEYHHMAGVEHFWVYNDSSVDNYKAVLQPYVDKGIVEVIAWPLPGGSTGYVEKQCEAFRDGLRRAQGNAKWVALIDIDEFLLPSKDKTITECLTNHFSEASGVYANWRHFGTGGITVPQNEPFLFRLTACSLKNHSRNCVGKSIVRPEQVRLTDLWYPHHFPLRSGAKYLNGDGQAMYFEGTDLKTDGKTHDKFIRINHYALRDENFYRTSRLAKANQGIGEKHFLLEHYEAFSLIRDRAILDFIKNKHPATYEKIWKKYE